MAEAAPAAAGAAKSSSTVASSTDKIQSLLRWCQAQTDGYEGVRVTNFTNSFRDGLAFCAILHRYRPDLIDYHSLKPQNWLANNQLAFCIAESIGIPALLDAEDMATPEKLSIITYVAYMNMHLRGKERRGGPSVNMFAGNSQQLEPQEQQSAKKRGNSCSMCSGDVFLLVRSLDTDGRLCHRQCLLDSRRGELRKAASEALEKRRRCDREDDVEKLPESPLSPVVPVEGGATLSVRQNPTVVSGEESAVVVVVRPASQDASVTTSAPLEPAGSGEAAVSESAPVEKIAPESAPESAPVESSALESAPLQSSAPESAPVQSSAPKSAPVESSAPESAPAEIPSSECGSVESSAPEVAPVQATARESAPAEAAASESAPKSAPAASSNSESASKTASVVGERAAAENSAPVEPAPATAQLSAVSSAAASPFGSPASIRRSARKPAPPPPPLPPAKRSQSQLPNRSATTIGASSASAAAKTKKVAVDVDLYPEEFNPFKEETPVRSKPPLPPPQRPPPLATAPRAPSSSRAQSPTVAYPEELNPFGPCDDEPQQMSNDRQAPTPPRPAPAGSSASAAAVSVSLPATRCSSMEPLYRAGSPLLSNNPSVANVNKSFRKSRHAPPPPPPPSQTQVSPKSSNSNATAPSAVAVSTPASAQGSPQSTPASTPMHRSTSDLHHHHHQNHQRSSSRTKGPAPPRPLQSERRQILTEAADEFEGVEAIEKELADVGARQAEIESCGRELYDKLKRAELDHSYSEEPLLLEWINLVNERNRLCREELYLLRRSEERELELQHSCIEFDLRRVMSKQEALKTESDRELERSLLAQLTEVVNRRARIIDLIDASQREQEKQEQLLAATLASASASVQANKSSKNVNSNNKKDGKKQKKAENLSKKFSLKLKKKSEVESTVNANNDEVENQTAVQQQKRHHRKFKLFSSVGCSGKNKEKKDET